MTRHCNKCNKEEEFYPKRLSRCISCEKEENMQRYFLKYKGTPESYERMKKGRIWSTFGITIEEYNELSSKQTSCAICLNSFEPGFDKQLDHCHSTGQIRAFLCHKCNKGLGMFKE